jgi:hypothetical protein
VSGQALKTVALKTGTASEDVDSFSDPAEKTLGPPLLSSPQLLSKLKLLSGNLPPPKKPFHYLTLYGSWQKSSNIMCEQRERAPPAKDI